MKETLLQSKKQSNILSERKNFIEEKLKILILEDVSFDAELIEYELRREGVEFSSKIVETEESFIKELEEYKPSIILADHSLPHFDGLSALKIASSKCPHTPFFFVSGKIREEFAVEMLKEGATDYIFKNNLSKLVPAIHRALKEAKEEVERRNAEKLLVNAYAELESAVQERTKELSRTNEELRMEITRRKQLEEALQESEKKLKEIIHVSPVPQFVIDNDHNITYWNRALEKYSNIRASEIIGTKKQWNAFYNDKRPSMADILVDGNIGEISKWYSGKYRRSEILDDAYEAIDFFPTMGYDGKWLRFTAAAIRNPKGYIIGAVETLEDITDQKYAQDEIRRSLEEKEVLLREIHHRVKNNLQIISSMINLQSSYIDDKKTVETFKEIQNRVKSIAIIHEKLYQSENISKINFADYIQKLTSDLCNSYGVISTVKLEINVDDILLDINTAIPCGLIINELVTNSIKHGFQASYVYESSNNPFTDYGKGKITINLKFDGDKYMMIVSDDGVGFPKNIDFQNTETLGLRLVNSLTAQINGKIELERKSKGTTFNFTFNL